MKKSTRTWGILLTFLFIGLAGYAGYELYQLPISIAENLRQEKDSRIREIRLLVLENKDKRGKNLDDRELLKAIRKELTRGVKGKESERLEIAQNLAMPAYQAFVLTLIMGVLLMFLLLASSYRTSAETIVYIEKQEEDEDEVQPSEKDNGRLVGLFNDLNSNPEAISFSKEGLENLLSQIASKLNVGAGAIYQVSKNEEIRKIELIAGYAFIVSDSETLTYEFGEGLAGQVAKTGAGKLFDSIPKGYVEVFSGLGESTPNYLAILPILKDKEVMGVIELAFLEKISEVDYQQLKKISNLIGKNM